MIRTAVFALSFLMNLRFKQVNDVPSNLLYRYPAVYRTHVNCRNNLSVLKLHPEWNITVSQMLVKWQSIEFNVYYIVERFYRVEVSEYQTLLIQ